MNKVKLLVIALILPLVFGCELSSPRGPNSGKAELIPLKKGINPVYVLTKKGLTVIDSKTDEIVTKGYKFKHIELSEISAFYKDKLITSFSGSDFPQTKANTYIWDLGTGRYDHASDLPVSFISRKDNFLYGHDYGFGDRNLIFTYDLENKRFSKDIRIDKSSLGPSLLGFVSLPGKQKGILLDNEDTGFLELRSLDTRNILYKQKSAGFSGFVADDTKAVLYGRSSIKVLDLVTKRSKVLPIKLPELYISFYAEGRLFLGKSPIPNEEDSEEMYRTKEYSVYRFADGKLIKKINMDLQADNTLKVDNLLVFLEGKQKGKALNLKTAKIEKAVNLAPGSVIQDGKIYSVSGNEVTVKNNKSFKMIKEIELDSESIDRYEENSAYFTIFNSEALEDNFVILNQAL